jgi:hypothetical protein
MWARTWPRVQPDSKGRLPIRRTWAWRRYGAAAPLASGMLASFIQTITEAEADASCDAG